MLSGEGNAGEWWKTTVGLISQKKQLCTCSTLFLYISLPLFCTTTTWNFQKLSYTIHGGNVVCVLVHFFFTAAYFHLALVATGIGRFQKISILYHGQLLGFLTGRGGSRLWNSEGMGGIYDWKSEGMGEFHRWDFWSRKCRVSSLKTLLLWTFVVRK